MFLKTLQIYSPNIDFPKTTFLWNTFFFPHFFYTIKNFILAILLRLILQCYDFVLEMTQNDDKIINLV